MQLADIVRDERSLVVHLAQGDLNLTYKPSGYTAAVESQIMDGLQTRPMGTLVKMLSPMLVGWDLLDGDKAFGMDEEALSKLPAQFLIAVLQTIMEDMRPNPKRSANSNAG